MKYWKPNTEIVTLLKATFFSKSPYNTVSLIVFVGKKQKFLLLLLWLIGGSMLWFYTLIKTYFSHMQKMGGWFWRALRQEKPFRLGKNLAARKTQIMTCDPKSGAQTSLTAAKRSVLFQILYFNFASWEQWLQMTGALVTQVINLPTCATFANAYTKSNTTSKFNKTK